MVDDHNLIGTQLGYYTLTRLIGKGGMGMVFVGKHAELQVEYAVKVLSRWTDDIFVARFRREAQRAAGLDHPHIIRVFHFGHDTKADVVYLVMNLVNGPSLRQLMRDAGGPLPVEQAVTIALQVLDGLDYAHRSEIIHRDIKPDNILLEGGEQVKIVDFGLARMRHDEANITTAQQALGTPEYMAMEQWEGRDIDARVDIHAVGIVLYEMLTGTKPFSGTPTSIFTSRLSDAFDPPSKLRTDLPEGLEAVVLKMMARHPDDRYATAAAAIDALLPFAPPDVRNVASTRRMLPAAHTNGGTRRDQPVLPDLPPRAANPGPGVSDVALSVGTIADLADPTPASTPPVSPSGRDAGAAVVTRVQTADTQKIDHRTLILPPIQSFTCQHSGECCRFKEIPLNRDEQQRIGARDWGPRLPHLVTQNPFAEGTRFPGRPTFNLEPADGRCPFHDPDQMLCVIHEQLGAHAKPLACQQFPYRFTVTPAGTMVGLSFSCPTVRRNVGRPVASQGPAIARFVQRSQINTHVPGGMEEVRLAPGRTASWDAILETGALIDSILADTSLPVWRALIAGERLVAQLQVAAAGMVGGKAPVPPEQIVERIRSEDFLPDRLGLGDMLFWARLTVRLRSRADMYYASHSPFSRFVHRFRGWRRWMRLLNGNLWGMRWRPADAHAHDHAHDHRGSPSGSDAEAATPPGSAGATTSSDAARRRNHPAPAWREQVKAADALAVSSALPAEADDMLRRFLRIQLHANDFFGPPVNRLSFVSGYKMLMVSISLVMFTARCRAAARSSHSLSFDDVDFAMATIADCFFSNSFFDRRLTPLIESRLTHRAGLARKLLLRWSS